jgi:hypothetical protein
MLGGNFPQPSVAQQMYLGLLVISTANFGQHFASKSSQLGLPLLTNTLFTAWKKLE